MKTTVYYRKAFGDLTPEERKLANEPLRKSRILGYNNAVEAYYQANKEDCLRYCQENFGLERYDQIEFDHKKAFFGSEGYTAAVESTFLKHQKDCLAYCKYNFDDVLSADDINYEMKKAFFASRGYEAAVESFYEAHKDECLEYCERTAFGVTSALDIDVKHKESFFGMNGFDAKVEKVYLQNQAECLEYFEAATDCDISYEQKRTFEGIRGKTATQAFEKHWKSIEKLARSSTNSVVTDGGDLVFAFEQSKDRDAYNYIDSVLKNLSPRDWRMKKANEAGLRLDKWDEGKFALTKKRVADKIKERESDNADTDTIVPAVTGADVRSIDDLLR